MSLVKPENGSAGATIREAERDEEVALFTIPNAISSGRLLLGLCFPLLPAAWHLLAVVAGALSDLLDGASGRLFHSCSRTGRVLDPVADKVFVAGVVVAFLASGVVTLGEVALVGLRDAAVIAGAAVALASGNGAALRRMAPTLLGKATTAAQFVFFVVLLVAPGLRWPAFAVTACLSALAAGHYLCLFLLRR